MSENQEDKTEEATAKQRSKFRERGEVAKSQELASAIMLSGAVLSVLILVSSGGPRIATIARGMLTRVHAYEEFAGAQRLWAEGILLELFWGIAPAMGLMCVFAVFAHMIQVGPMWTTKVFEPKPSKFNPFTGIKRLLFSKDTAMNLVRTLLKVGLLAAATGGVLWYVASDIPMLIAQETPAFAQMLHEIVLWPLFFATLLMLIIGVGDYFWQRHRMEERMKMSPDELKRDHKESEGDPLIKGKRRQKHRDLLQVNQMIQEVGEATVVINNPTHYSVAIRYRPDDGAPIVVAKGADQIALRIREAARENDVPMLTRPPLARALHKNVEVGHYIPEEFFKAVAEILAYVYTHHRRFDTEVR